MSKKIFNIEKSKSLLKTATACFLILINGVNLFAQYRGAPVKQERLLKVLRSRQLQTRDIVSVINSNGVDFKLTPEIRQLLIAAGARPEVIKAAANNARVGLNSNSMLAKGGKQGKNDRNKPVAPNYDDLIEQALYSYKDQQNPNGAVNYLKAAVKLNPKNSAAYQMLGFVNMYGLKNLSQAEKLMRESIANGGSAVFRVYHDDTGGFSGRCSGSLYISPESLRFESDDNRHTFETSTVNIDRFKLDHESNKTWKNQSVLKVFLKIGKDKANFRFSPISGFEEETKMVGRFIRDSKIDSLIPISATAIDYR
jgi:tetratricopeptide (TPR) repeat protein